MSKIGGSGMILDVSDGGEAGFHERFIEDRILGEGEFGVVTLVHDLTIRRDLKLSASQHGSMNGSTNGNATNNEKRGKILSENDTVGCVFDESSMACKTLRKGMVFKYNTVYAPLKPEVLKREVEILKKLNGEDFCLKMFAVYETTRVIYVITELCSGGDMIQYVSRREEDLRTDEVSRISYQLLTAVDHCAKNNVINRDIKPENIMFTTSGQDSELRLIDFGSGTNKVMDGMHTTFAGTAFYISPEMFQNTYTQKTDVWSAGVCLYVLVAGYPSDKLQTAFNMMHKITPGERNLKDLPNMPENLPGSYHKMLKELLEYKHKKRKFASQILEKSDFVRFHKFASSVERSNIIGSVGRHSLFLDYQKFERCLTTLLATMLSKSELTVFVETVHNELREKLKEEESKLGNEEKVDESIEIPPNIPPIQDKSKSLDVINVGRVIEILRGNDNQQILTMIEKLPGSDLYDSFAYDIAVLKYFVGKSQGGGRQRHSGTAIKNTTSSRVFGKIRQSLDNSLHSVSGRIRAHLDWSGHSSNSSRMRPASMDGSNHSYTAKKVAQFPMTTRPAAPLS